MPFSFSMGGHFEKPDDEKAFLHELRALIKKFKAEGISFASWSGSHTGKELLAGVE